MRIRLLPALLLIVLVTAMGCASARAIPETGEVRLHPGKTFTFEDRTYRMDAVAGDFVFLRRRDEAGDKGEISGWVEEVFRVDREYLSEGIWNMHPSLSGLYLRWLGGESFSITRDASVLRTNEPKLLK